MTAGPRSRWARPGVLGTLLAGACLLAGCGSAAPPPPARAASTPLGTSLTAAGGGTWVVLPMGGSAADEDNFWELFTQTATSAKWTLVTPPGVADNGGMVAAAPADGQSLDIAFRPSQDLTFSPLALTGDGGKTWGTGLLDAAVAAVPDAFAVSGGTMLALLDNGAVDQATAAGTSWTTLAAPGAVAASAAGRRCGVTGLTAVAYTTAGTPLVAASCASPGVVGIFARSGGTWAAAGPAVTGSLARQPVRVLRLTAAATGNIALLQGGTGSSASLFAAWSDDGSQWTVSSPLPAGSGQVRASGTGAGGTVWVLLSDGRAAAVSGAGQSWQTLPAPPSGTAALAAGSGGTFDALAVSGAKLTVFRLSDGAWDAAQVINVPIQYGSSS